MDWSADKTKTGEPMAVLKDGDKVVAKVYLSPDQGVLRIVLPEMSKDTKAEQVKVDWAHGLIDFRRRP